MQSILPFCVDVFTLQQGRFVSCGTVGMCDIPPELQFYCHNWEEFLLITLTRGMIAELRNLRSSVLRGVRCQVESLRCARQAMGDDDGGWWESQVRFFDDLHAFLLRAPPQEGFACNTNVDGLIRALAAAMDAATRIRHRIGCDEDPSIQAARLGAVIHSVCALSESGVWCRWASCPPMLRRLFKSVVVQGSHAPSGVFGPFAMPTLVGVRGWLPTEAWDGQGSYEPAFDDGFRSEAWKYGGVGGHENWATAFPGKAGDCSKALPYGVIGEPRPGRSVKIE